MTGPHLTMVCHPVGEGTHMPVPGSTITECAHCATPVWIAPTSQPYLHAATVLCFSCVVRLIGDNLMRGEEIRFGGFLPGQLEELMRDADNDN